MLVTLFCDRSDVPRVITVEENLKNEIKFSSIVTNPRKDMNVSIFEIENGDEETVTKIMDYFEKVKWSFPDKIYIVFKKNDIDNIDSFKGNHRGEFTRIFRDGIVVNMFV